MLTKCICNKLQQTAVICHRATICVNIFYEILQISMVQRVNVVSAKKYIILRKTVMMLYFLKTFNMNVGFRKLFWDHKNYT